MDININNIKLSVVIPVYNEKSTIKEVLNRVKAVKINKEIIVVDDGSTDGTSQILEEERDAVVTVHSSKINFGKGAAVRIGFKYAKGDIVIIQDADLELDPNEYFQLIGPIIDGRTDVVYGSRFLKRKFRTKVSPLNLLANKIFAIATNIMYGSNITDMATAYKVFNRKILDNINLKSFGFEIEPELTAKILKKGYKIYEVPISYHPRLVKEGKKITWKDGIKYLFTLLKYRIKE